MIASGALREKHNNPQYYHTLVNFPLGIPSPYENQIEMDLHRTFPSDPFFKEDESINALRNILLAYSRRNVTIGYCQGFNFIVGRIYKITKNEENAFWIFVQLIESILPISYYSELSGIIVDTSILHILLKMYHQDLYAHLVEIGYDLSLNNILYKWFVSLFIQNTNEDLSFIIWDSLFLEGNIVLFFASLAMFRLLKYDMMQATSMEDMHMLLDDGIYQYNDKDSMYWYCIIKRFEFDYMFLNKHRGEFEKQVSETILKSNKSRLDALKAQKRCASYARGVVMCQKSWPICIYDLDYKYNNILSFLIFRQGTKVVFIDNYFFDQCNKKPYKCRSSKDIFASSISESANIIENQGKEEKKISKITKKIYSELDSEKRNKSLSPKKIEVNNNNNEALKFNAYLNLLLERREHICQEDEDEIEISQDEKQKLQREEFMRKQTMSYVQDFKNYLRKDDRELFNQTMDKLVSKKKADEQKIIETFKEKSNLLDFDYEY